jgi:hypothetical protein
MSDHTGRPTGDGLVLEAWGQGLMVGSLLIMAAITLSNMKKHILLHKLILAEVSTHSNASISQFLRGQYMTERDFHPPVPIGLVPA